MRVQEKAQSLSELVNEEAHSIRLELPVFPGAALELQQLLAADDVSVDRISQVISKDQALASHVLRLANSAFYSGESRSIRTIKDAIMRLGSNQIFNLVICSVQQSYHKSSNKILSTYLNTLWQHALSVAIGSKWLVQELGHRKLAEEAFLSGLLHDIGKLLLVKVIESIKFKGKNIDLSEALFMQTVESLHSEHGHKLLYTWSMPIAYCNVCLNHHNKIFDTGDIVLLSVRISDHVCRKISITTNPEKPTYLTALPETKALNVGVNVLSALEAFMLDSIKSEYNTLNGRKDPICSSTSDHAPLIRHERIDGE